MTDNAGRGANPDFWPEDWREKFQERLNAMSEAERNAYLCGEWERLWLDGDPKTERPFEGLAERYRRKQ